MRKYIIDKNLIGFIFSTEDDSKINSILDYYKEIEIDLVEKLLRRIVMEVGITLDEWANYYSAQDELLGDEKVKYIEEIIFSAENKNKVDELKDSIYKGVYDQIALSEDEYLKEYVEIYRQLLVTNNELALIELQKGITNYQQQNQAPADASTTNLNNYEQAQVQNNNSLFLNRLANSNPNQTEINANINTQQPQVTDNFASDNQQNTPSTNNIVSDESNFYPD
jgi:hypothetical protein